MAASVALAGMGPPAQPCSWERLPEATGQEGKGEAPVEPWAEQSPGRRGCHRERPAACSARRRRSGTSWLGTDAVS